MAVRSDAAGVVAGTVVGRTAAGVVAGAIRPGPVLVVDDIVDSRWTFTEIASVLKSAGAGTVYPLALANTAGTGGSQ